MRIGSPEEDAWHEAGHAVIALALGARVTSLTLEDEDARFEGRAVVLWPAAPPGVRAEWSAQVALAGPLTELAQFGDGAPTSPSQLSAWKADWEEVERCAALLAPDPGERTLWIERRFKDVEGLLARSEIQERIARVADALDAHGTLDETLIEDCI